LLVSIGIWVASSAGLSAAENEPLSFVEKHCVSCHDADTKKGNLDLTALQPNFGDATHFAAWVKVFDRVAAGEMPPKKQRRHTPVQQQAFLDELGESLKKADRTLAAASGRGAVRRMNRVEYENSLRDLLALPLLRVKQLLPEDGQQFGFDKVAGALDITHIQMTKYLQAADIALKQAVIREAKAPEKKTWRGKAAEQDSMRAAIAVHSAVPLLGRELAPGLTTHIAGNPVADIGNCYLAAQFAGKADAAALLTGVKNNGHIQGVRIDGFNPTAAGQYRVRFSTWGLRWERTRATAARLGTVRQYQSFDAPYFQDEKKAWRATASKKTDAVRNWRENAEFYGDADVTHVVRASLEGQVLGYFDAPSLEPTTHELTVWLRPGEHVSFQVMTLPASGAANWATTNGVRDYEGPAVAFDWFEVEGPLAEQWPPESQRRLFGTLPATSTPARTDHPSLLQSFAARAFRRPVAADEVAPYAAIVEAQLKRGVSFEQAVLAGYKGILCSPDFLLIGLESGVPKSGATTLGDYTLASRLSFFLWNSLPDATLLDLAAKNELSVPAALDAQAERMLIDPRSDRFIEHFLDQWLELKKIDFTTPDPTLYPEYDPWLRDSMLAETRGWFRRSLTRDLGVRELIASDTVLIDQRLAELYGIRGVKGSKLREMKLPEGSPRGGLLTQASVLKVTANGTATSPVLRGLWVTERLLGIPRQPPPPNIPAVEPDATGAVTIRQMIEKHRESAACATCHARMDPPGMALENFDVIGGYRDRYRLAGAPRKILRGKVEVLEPSIQVVSASANYFNRVTMRLGSEVDATGELIDGRKFADLNGLRAILLADEDTLARNLASQLMIYGTGAGIRFADRADIEAIVARSRPTHHGLRSLLREVVASELFRRK